MYRVVGMAVVLVGCDAFDSLGRTVQGLDGTNSCSVGGAAWMSPRDAVANGATGDQCLFGGGAVDSGRTASCFAGELILQEDHAEATNGCGALGDPSDDAAPVAQGNCVRYCGRSSGAIGDQVACVIEPNQAPRSLEVPWSLVDPTSCDLVMRSCPQQGDPCTGSFVCQGEWPIGHVVPFGSNQGTVIFRAVSWCSPHGLRIARSL